MQHHDQAAQLRVTGRAFPKAVGLRLALHLVPLSRRAQRDARHFALAVSRVPRARPKVSTCPRRSAHPGFPYAPRGAFSCVVATRDASSSAAVGVVDSSLTRRVRPRPPLHERARKTAQAPGGGATHGNSYRAFATPTLSSRKIAAFFSSLTKRRQRPGMFQSLPLRAVPGSAGRKCREGTAAEQCALPNDHPAGA